MADMKEQETVRQLIEHLSIDIPSGEMDADFFFKVCGSRVVELLSTIEAQEAEIKRLNEEVSRLVDRLEWKVIDKDTPHNGAMLLLSNINDKWIVVGSYEKVSKNTNIPKAGWYNQFECDCPIYPTHWMPLPLPPVGDK